MTMSMGAPDPQALMAAGAPPEAGPAIPPDPLAGPMNDQPAPDPAEIAHMLGSSIAQQREQAHQMVDQMAEADLQQVLQMVTSAAQGAQVLGEGQVA